MLWQSFFWESAFSPRGHRRTASSVWWAAHCTVHRKQPPLRRHQPVSTLVETSGRCCRGSRLIYQQAILSPPGGAPARSAPVPECGLARQSRFTVLASMSAPSFNSRRVISPRGVDHSASCEEKTFSGILSSLRNWVCCWTLHQDAKIQ